MLPWYSWLSSKALLFHLHDGLEPAYIDCEQRISGAADRGSGHHAKCIFLLCAIRANGDDVVLNFGECLADRAGRLGRQVRLAKRRKKGNDR